MLRGLWPETHLQNAWRVRFTHALMTAHEALHLERQRHPRLARQRTARLPQTSGCDVICLQETKAAPEQVDLSWLTGYEAVWSTAVKKGYSGTCVLTEIPFIKSTLGIGQARPR